MFDDAIRKIYDNSQPKEHKKLALLIALLPYCNMRHNIICKDTSEEIIDCIQPYSIKELCILLKQANITRFKKDLLDLSVNGKPVFMFSVQSQAQIITVNPTVFYSGTTIEELDYLIGYFKIKS